MDSILILCLKHPSPVYKELLGQYASTIDIHWFQSLEQIAEDSPIPIRSENNCRIWEESVRLRKENSQYLHDPLLCDIIKTALSNR